MIISRTPFRISFFGGGTDYPVWFREHGGAVLATTIDKYCYISCRYLPPFFEHRTRIAYSRIEAGQDQSSTSSIRLCGACSSISISMRDWRSITTETCLPARDWAPVPRLPSGCFIRCMPCSTSCPAKRNWPMRPFMLNRMCCRKPSGAKIR